MIWSDAIGGWSRALILVIQNTCFSCPLCLTLNVFSTIKNVISCVGRVLLILHYHPLNLLYHYPYSIISCSVFSFYGAQYYSIYTCSANKYWDWCSILFVYMFLIWLVLQILLFTINIIIMFRCYLLIAHMANEKNLKQELIVSYWEFIFILYFL